MTRIALIACTKTKAAHAAPAAMLYRSPLFRKSLLYAMSNADRVYIISAKYGILAPDEIVDPYELSIKQLKKHQKGEWIRKVESSLKNIISKKDQALVLAGAEYTKPMLRPLREIGCTVRTPLAGKSLGSRISWLRSENREAELVSQIKSFYANLRDLYIGQDGGRLLGDCTGRMTWPARGVYFLFEPGEHLMTNAFRPLLDRVVRIGTHGVSRGSKTTLWDRISTHRGVIAGAGNHRSSIFRLHVGAALIRREPSHWQAPEWGVGQVASAGIREAERALEHEVSRALSGMRLLWLHVPDEPGPHSDRSYLEKNAIGLLSRWAILNGGQSEKWLGHWSRQINIALSGLWNLDHLYRVPDPSFPHVLARYVSVTLGKTEPPREPLAPVAWYRDLKQADSPQFSLFDHDPAKSSLR